MLKKIYLHISSKLWCFYKGSWIKKYIVVYIYSSHDKRGSDMPTCIIMYKTYQGEKKDIINEVPFLCYIRII